MRSGVIGETPALSQFHIRLAREADLPALEWDGEYTHFQRLYAETYRQAQIGDALMWIAELNASGLVGQLFVQLKSPHAELADGLMRAYIYGFRVKPAYRNLGLGTRMMEVVEADLGRRGYQSVCLNVAQENTSALSLYQRLGYQIVASDPGQWSYIDDRGLRRFVSEPAWRMEKQL